MIKSKYISIITTILLVFALILSLGFTYCVSNEVVKSNNSAEYLTKLFDDSIVHTIDIQIGENDWNSLLENAINEEYYLCDVIIDGEKVNNVGIRAKGNTSLSQIVNSESDRYSFKIEFNHYNDGNLYYGLDKLALNNLMADATYMKDYLTYDMMNFIGANAPYSAFMNITVNGEPWGLYLGVECIDSSFLTRNYGRNYGELYKPDNMEMGGGGKGGQDRVNLNDLSFFKDETDENTVDGKTASENINNSQSPDIPNRQGNMNRGFNREEVGQMPNGNNPQMPVENQGARPKMPNGEMPNGEMPNGNFNREGKGGAGRGGKGSDLVYTDDNLESYSTLLESTKTNSTEADKKRLINSLKVLSTGTNLSSVIDIENTLKYWVVHNFVCNYDSYTGNMLHNYYLYEENGIMTMLPWDYNLAFGGFSMGSKWQGDTDLDGATLIINKAIDSPLNSGTEDERPFWGKLIQNETYKDLYHSYFETFINEYFESGHFEEKMNNMYHLLLPYIQNDNSAFYTEEEFENGFKTLKELCLLRSDSILKQLDGEISIDGLSYDNYIDGSHLNIQDLGSQGDIGMGVRGPENFNNQFEEKFENKKVEAIE